MKLAIKLEARSGHLLTVISALIDARWKPVTAPTTGRLPRNGLHLTLHTPDVLRRFRILVYKVSRSSRNRDWERRVEITSTYQGGLRPARGYRDVVLGFHADEDIFVGLDPIRLRHGGATSNASSFLEADGLKWTNSRSIQIISRSTELRPEGIEYQAYFKPTCLADYLLNATRIHTGTFSGPLEYASVRYVPKDRYVPISIYAEKESDASVTFQSPKLRKRGTAITKSLIMKYEDTAGEMAGRKKISPQLLRQIQLRCEECGQVGERFVLDHERRRLSRAGHRELAGRVKWVSQESVNEGYDIASFELDGSPRFIEVKSTVGMTMTFFISTGEWNAAKRLRDQYFLYRVVNSTDRPKIAKIICNPIEAEICGVLEKTPDGYKVRIT